MHLSLAHGHSLSTMLAVAAVAMVLTGAFYYRAYGTLRARHWMTLLALRAAAITLVVLLLFRPVLSYQNTMSERPAVVFLLDRSASMSIADDASGVSRFDQARQKMQQWHDKLSGDFRLLPIVFAEQAQPLDDWSQLPSIEPTGKGTSLSRALTAASKELPPSDVPTVLLLSDGIHNASGDPVATAGKLKMTVHAIGVGAGLRGNLSYRDVQVTGVDCPDRMILNNLARVTGSIDAIGLGGHVVEAFLDEDDQQVAQAELTLDDTEGSQQVTFEFRPTVKGRHTYTVRIPPVGNEQIVENNRRSAVATVTEPSIRVLYIEGTLRAEYGALVNRFLAKDPDLEFCSLVQTKPNVFLRRTNIHDLQLNAIPADQATFDRFDVFILGDLDSSYLRPEQQEMLTQRIRAGAGLIMLGGYHSLGPGGYEGTPVGNLLPVGLGARDVGQVTDPFLPMLTPEGVRHPIFANIADFFPTRQGPPKIEGLPPLDGCTRVKEARPGATVLAVCPIQDSMPVLAVQPVDHGRTAVFAGDTTRAWQQGPQAQGQESPFSRFWGQTVRWLAGRESGVETQASVAAATDKAHYELGEPIRITAIVRDKEGQGANKAEVEATVRVHDGKPQKVAMSTVTGPSGHFAGTVELSSAGEYEVVVDARLGETNLTSDVIPIEVGRPNLEFERLDLDENNLQAIARAAGGRYVPLSTADHLIEQLDRQQKKRTEHVEKPLYWPPAFWVLIVTVLTVEWTMRRKFQMR